MAKEDKDSNQDDGKQKKSRLPGCLLIVIIVAVVGFIAKIAINKVEVQKKTKAYIEEANAHIEARRFNRAEETLELANELNPNRREILNMQTDLKEARVINFYEKELTRTLQSKDWDKVRDAVTNLKIRDPQHPQIESALQEIKDGMHKEKLGLLVSQLSAAQKQGNLQEVVKNANSLLAHDPENPTAARWEDIKTKATEEIQASEKKAAQFYEQAKLVDKGVYSSELYTLASKAKSLSEKPVYKAFYEKVSKYPRIIRYPNEYSNLQDAIDAARPIDTVQVAEGSYHAPIRVDKEIKIVGAEGKTVVLHASGKTSPVVYVTSAGKLNVQHIMFKHVDPSEEETAYSTIVVEGEANFTSCAIYQSSGHGAHVINGGKLVVDSCRLENNRWDGVAASGASSLATLQRSVVTLNKHHGIDAWEGGKVEMFDSFSESNLRSGVVATKGGSVKIIGSTIRLNQHTGLYLTDGANALVKRSEFSKNGLAGGYGDRSGDVTLEETKVLGNSEAGIVLTKGTIDWKGLETIQFSGNAGKEIWKDAEFRISEILKEILPEEKEEEPKSETQEEDTDNGEPVETTSAETPDSKTDETPKPAIIIEE